MQTGALLLLLAVLILVVFFIARPFSLRALRLGGPDQETSSLLAERERLLEAVQELDFDNLLGKIPAGEYGIQRRELLEKGAQVLRQLDGRQAVPAWSTDSHPEAGSSRKSALGARQAAPSDEEIEDLITQRRGVRGQQASGFCPNCGKPVLATDRFCPTCGQPLQ